MHMKTGKLEFKIFLLPLSGTNFSPFENRDTSLACLKLSTITQAGNCSQ